MTFHELPLYIATYQVFRVARSPGSDSWLGRKAKMTYQMVLHQIVENEAWTDHGIPWSIDHVIDAWRSLRKVKKSRLLCEVAMTHGQRCFYSDRGLGACSDDLDLDRLVSGARGGKYTVGNCVITCSFHNRSRGDLSIEDFLQSQNVLAAEESLR